MSSNFIPTAEQHAIFDHLSNTNDSLIIDAKAGVGKTATLVAAMTAGLLSGTTLVMAFNKSIADDIGRRLSSAPLAVRAQVASKTVHSHGLQAFKKAGRQAQTQGGKLHFLMKDQMSSCKSDDPVQRNARHVVRLVSMAKAAGFGLQACDGKERFAGIRDIQAWTDLIEHFNLDNELEAGMRTESLIEEAIELLETSNRKLGMIDFDDMIYLPLFLDLPIPTYANVLIDEAQDINATRRELAFRSVAGGDTRSGKPGRIVAVGDPNQAIYGFTGASTRSLDQIADRIGNAKVLPLSTCWRCDDAILDEARKIVPTIRTAPAKVGKGSVYSVAFRMEPGEKLAANLQTAGQDFLAMPRPGDAILCRLNKPNVATALGLLRRGTPAKIEGRDLGKKLLEHLKKANDSYAFEPLSDQLATVEIYREQEVYKLLKKERESAAELLRDEVDALLLLMERMIELQPKAMFVQLESATLELFGDDVSSSNVVTLSSVHKAKGREWPRVFLLGRSDYMPFFKAEAEWELEQEDNLIYVAVTRAEKELIYVTGVQSAIDKGLHRLPALAPASPNAVTS
jgi:superfamily I DNA/RNA helicase